MVSDLRLARFAVILGLVLAPGLAHGAPNARDRETARSLMDEGDKKFGAADYPAALEAYKAAYALVAVPTTGIAVARAQAALGQLVEARDTALAVTRYPQEPREPAPFRAARAAAEDLSRTLLPRIPSVQVAVTGPPAGSVVHVQIDGNALPDEAAVLPAKVNPGKHAVAAWAEHFAREEKELTLAEGAHVPLTIALRPEATANRKPAPSTAPPPGNDTPPAGAPARGNGHTLTYLGLAIGAVGMAVGSVAGVVSLSRTASAKEHCTGEACSPAARSDIDASLLWANVSNVGFAVGAVGAVVLVVSLLTSDSNPAPAPRAQRLVPTFRAGGAGVMGSF